MASEVIQTIKHRRSIRAFRRQPIPEEIIAELLDAGRYAPSAMGLQTPHYIVVTNPQVIWELSRLATSIVRWFAKVSRLLRPFVPALRDKQLRGFPRAAREKDLIFYGAPCVIFLVARRRHLLGEKDCMAAAQNMMVAARALEIGSVFVGYALPLTYVPRARRLIGLPRGYKIHGCVAFGHPLSFPRELPARKENLLNWVR